jgi:hypothetical protein
MREPPLDHPAILVVLGQRGEQRHDPARHIGERQALRQPAEVVNPLGSEAEKVQGKGRMCGQTRAEVRPRHHEQGGGGQRHGHPHVRGVLEQP